LRGFVPDFSILFMCTSCAHDHCLTTQCPAPPSEVRRVHACVFLYFSSLPHTYKCIESNLFLSRLLSTSTSKVRLNNCHPLCMNEHLRFNRNFLWAWPNNSNNPPPDLKVSSITLSHPLLFYILVFQWRLLS
jgi:hypothetical protein